MIDNVEMIRCPGCRGAKKIPKLGGVIGECNTCKGTGKIKACDKPVMILQVPVEPVSEIVKAVSESVPVDGYKTIKEDTQVLGEPDIKIDPKRALYKRKTAGSENHGAL